MSLALCTTRDAVLNLDQENWPLFIHRRAFVDDKKNPNPEIKQLLPYTLVINADTGKILAHPFHSNQNYPLQNRPHSSSVNSKPNAPDAARSTIAFSRHSTNWLKPESGI